MLRPYFGCESDLINVLLRSGLGEQRILELFWQHRRSYVSPVDFARIRCRAEVGSGWGGREGYPLLPWLSLIVDKDFPVPSRSAYVDR